MPVPAGITVNVNWAIVNDAATFRACVIATTHVPVPLQPSPLHPLNVEPVAAAAVSVTEAL